MTMPNNVSGNNYANLLGNTQMPTPPTGNAQPPALPAAPPPPSDSLSLSAAANTTAAPAPPPAPPSDSLSLSATANTTAAAAPSVREELMRLRNDLNAINQQIDALLAGMEGAPAAPAAPAAPTAPAAPAAPTAQPAAGGNYEVKGGDYLWKIAKEQLGDPRRWTEIYELNKDTIGDNPNLIYPGQALKMPGGAAPSTPPATPAPPQGAPSPNPATPPTPTPPPGVPAPSAPVTPPGMPPAAPGPVAGVPDVPAVAPSNRPLTDAHVMSIANEFGLAPDKANVTAFLDEMDSYETVHKGSVFGPGMENLAANPQEADQIKQSVSQLQQAFGLLIKAGKLQASLPNGQPVTELAVTGSFFKLDPQGQPVKDPNGNPVMDDAFIAAVTKFKSDQQVHQNYKLADGSNAINEYIGPGTIEALKKAIGTLAPQS